MLTVVSIVIDKQWQDKYSYNVIFTNKEEVAMGAKSGVQSVKVVPGRKIIISTGSGSTSVEEIKQLTETVLKNAKSWNQSGWAYVADCTNVQPVTPAEAGELVVMTKKLVEAGCKALGFVEGKSVMLKVQAQKNTQRSATGVAEGDYGTSVGMVGKR